MKNPLDKFKRKNASGVKSVSVTYDTDKVLIVPIGDVHLGAPTCNVDKFGATIEWVKSHDCQVILMGDLLEAASKSSVGAGWVEQVQSPQDQLDTLFEVLEPIKDKIIVSLEGNHEERIWKSSGIQVAKVLADRLGVPFGGYSTFIRVKVKRQNYVIHAQHGSSNAWYPHTKLTAAMRTKQHTTADIYLYGHVHELLSLMAPDTQFDLRSGSVKVGKQYFVLTGSFLEYEGSYAQKKNMYPTRTGVANVHLSGKKWDVHIST